MSRVKDIVGKVYGHLTVVEYVGQGTGGRRSLWKCKCDCGRECIRSNRYLVESPILCCDVCHIVVGKERRHLDVQQNGRNRKDVRGWRFGRLVALERVGFSKSYSALWRCRCDCGKEVVKDLRYLTGGLVRSCGCLRRDEARKRALVSGAHYMADTRLYNIWARMKQRCHNENDKDHYTNYGGRGIVVCEEWRNSFSTFAEWALANGYKDDLTIDRIDNNGNYAPDNCRWTTMKVQRKNARVRLSKYTGERTNFSALCKAHNIRPSMLFYRLRKGMSLEEAVDDVLKLKEV